MKKEERIEKSLEEDEKEKLPEKLWTSFLKSLDIFTEDFMKDGREELLEQKRHARSKGFILVTNNVQEFARVKNLVLENWVV